MMRWYYWPDKARSQEATCFDKIQLNELIRLGNRMWISSLMRLSCFEDVLVLFSVGCFNKKWPASQRTIYIRKLWSASGKEHISRFCTRTFSGGYHCSTKRQLSSAKSLQKNCSQDLAARLKLAAERVEAFLLGTKFKLICILTSKLGKKRKWKIFSSDRNNATTNKHFHFQPSKSESENDSPWWEQCSK